MKKTKKNSATTDDNDDDDDDDDDDNNKGKNNMNDMPMFTISFPFFYLFFHSTEKIKRTTSWKALCFQHAVSPPDCTAHCAISSLPGMRAPPFPLKASWIIIKSWHAMIQAQKTITNTIL